MVQTAHKIELKIENNSKLTYKQEMFVFWTIDGTQENFDPKTNLDRFGSFIVMYVVHICYLLW